MGSGASSKVDPVGIPRSLTIKQKNSRWKKVDPHRLALMATIKMKGAKNNLWSESRFERHPWKELLQGADNFVLRERQQLGSSSENIEGGQLFRSLMEGCLPSSPLTTNRREVWVFISSTFTDTVLERNLLMEDVYPYIRAYARKLGLDFNAVDFRWGIRKSVCNQHKAAEICLKEVERCKRTSCGPWFVAILGQKYGFRPIPPVMKKTVFEKIVSCIKQMVENDPKEVEALELIQRWYKLDMNQLDPEYILQPIDELLPDFYKDDCAAGEEWNKVVNVMKRSLYLAVRHAGLDPETTQALTMSITEGEIIEGLENADELVKQDGCQCFVFNRILNNFDKSKESAKRYIDFQDGKVDGDAQSRLSEVRNHIKNKIPQANCHRYNLRYLEDREAMASDKQNQAALRKFADQFCNFMISSIQKGAIESEAANEHALFSEVLNHTVFARERADSFEGREVILQNIQEAIEMSKVVLVYGNGGCGKTSLLCKSFAQNMTNWTDKEDRPVFMFRSVGTTPKSSNIRGLLHSLCRQLVSCFRIPQVVPADFKGLQRCFASLLDTIGETKLFIILDSLDQLSGEDNAHDLEWMPENIPDNVCFVLSVLSEVKACLAAAKNLTDQCIKVLPLGEKDKVDILELLLKKRGRTLNFEQKAHILQSNSNPTALYVRLVSDIASNWRSYTPISRCNLAVTTTGLIEQFFSELELKHGEVFVRSALGYLTAAKTGISAGELLDVLSCDDVVLDDVFEFHIPPIRRLPPLLWTRLRLDLGPYLVEGGSESVILFRWHHRLFHEVAYTRYVADSAPFLHQSLANYFMSRWADTPKPYHDKESKSVRVAHRRVQPQPLILNDGPGIEYDQRKYNTRKMSELPTRLISGAMWEEAETVLCSIPWIEAKCHIGDIYQLLVELDEASKKCPSRTRFRDFYKMIRANTSILQDHPDLVCQQSLNEPDKSTCVVVARNYLKTNPEQLYCLVNLSKSQSPNPEVMRLPHKASVSVVQFSNDGSHVATASSDGIVRAWRVTSGTLEIECEADAFRLFWSKDCHWVGVMCPSGIKLVGLGTGGGYARGQEFTSISIELEMISQPFLPKNNKHLFVMSMGRLSIYSINTGTLIQKKELRCRPSAAAFDSNGKYLALAYKNVFLWDITTEEVSKEFDTEKRNKDFKNAMLEFSSDSKRLLAVLPSGTYIWNVKGTSRTCIGHPFSLNSSSFSAVCSPRLDFLMSLNRTATVEVLKISPSVEWYKLLGHQAPVLCADFCVGPDKNTLVGTGGEDRTVRIWDTSELTSQRTVKVQRHDTPVTAGLFSKDGTKAVTSDKNKLFLWSMQTNPPLVSKSLVPRSPCDLKSVAAISEDALFVAALCGHGGVDIWFINKPPVHYNDDTIEAEHLLVPFANPHYFFVCFQRGLMACFTTLNKLGTVILFEIISETAISDWMHQPEITPKWKEYQMNITELTLENSHKLSPSGDQLATLSIQASEELIYSTLVNNKKTDFMKGSLELRIWDIFSQDVQRVIPMDGGFTRYHSISYLGENPLVFVQERKKSDGSRQFTGNRNRRKSSSLQSRVTILKCSTGEVLGSTVTLGGYTNLHVPDKNYVHSEFPVLMQTQMLTLSQEDKGILFLSKVGLSPKMGKFSHRMIKVSCHCLSADGQNILVGLEDGQVVFLRVA